MLPIERNAVVPEGASTEYCVCEYDRLKASVELKTTFRSGPSTVTT